MSRYYSDMSASALRDELDRLEENLSELEDNDAMRIGIQNSIYYICEALCRMETRKAAVHSASRLIFL